MTTTTHLIEHYLYVTGVTDDDDIHEKIATIVASTHAGSDWIGTGTHGIDFSIKDQLTVDQLEALKACICVETGLPSASVKLQFETNRVRSEVDQFETS